MRAYSAIIKSIRPIARLQYPSFCTIPKNNGNIPKVYEDW